MSRFFTATRYRIIVPVFVLGFTAAAFFVIGGFSLIRLPIEGITFYQGPEAGFFKGRAFKKECPPTGIYGLRLCGCGL